MLTNLWTPYRNALWNACVSPGVTLTVGFLAESEPGRQWGRTRSVMTYRAEQFGAAGIRYGDGRLYRLRHGQLSALSGFDAAILGGWESPAHWQARRWAQKSSAATVGFYEITLRTQSFSSGPVAGARRRFFTGLDFVLTVGDASPAAVVAMGVEPGRVVTGTNSVDGHHIAEVVQKMRAPQGAGHRYLYVGQLIRRKRPDLVIQAFGRVAGPDDHLRVVGDGPMRSALEDLVAAMGTSASVTFTGHLTGDHLLQQYAWGQTLVMPSETEVWGLVVNEALSAGLHVVASDRAGVTQTVQDMTGVYVTAPEQPAVVAAMEQSRHAWSGWVAELEMLQHGPDAQALSLVRAVELGCAHLRSRRMT